MKLTATALATIIIGTLAGGYLLVDAVNDHDGTSLGLAAALLSCAVTALWYREPQTKKKDP